MEFYSHPDKKLKVHLEEVKDYAQSFLGTSGTLSLIACLAHDFGKYTTFFQRRLREGTKGDHRADHSFISAIFGAYLGMEMTEEDTYLPLLVYHIIFCHHGKIKNFEESLEEFQLEAKLEVAELQRKDMLHNLPAIKEEYDTWGLGQSVVAFLREEDFTKITEFLRDLQCNFQVIDSPGYRNYFRLQQYYSALIAADKLSASNTPIIEHCCLSWEQLNTAKFKLLARVPDIHRNKDLDILRSSIFDAVHYKLSLVYEKSNLFSITSATGTGKTLCGFFAAVRLRELLGDHRKIIYGLPFTSIIEQNYDDLYTLMDLAVDRFADNSSSYLIKHHSLADVDYETEDYQINKLKAEMLLENWSSSVVVTTFVQIMETLISNKNRMMKKFHSFNHSIILLDEVQALPAELLKVIDFALKKAAEELDCRIIMMTATKPVLLQDAVELLDDHESYFKRFSRTKLVYEKEKITISEFADNFLSSLEDKSYLIICNTIQESLDLYNEVKSCERTLFYLSTNLLPIHRKKRIREIERSLSNGQNPIVISTQVVEAGVNFDFDYVIRDIGPLSAVIQAAGRENRHGKRARSPVRVCCLCNESGKLYGAMVYGHTTIAVTQNLLENKGEILEEDYLQLIEEYFKHINAKLNQDASKEFMKSIEEMDYTHSNYSIGEFSLIQEKQGYLDVFLQIDHKAEGIYSDFLEMLAEKDVNERHLKHLEIKQGLAEYTLSIPMRFSKRINHVKEEAIWTLPIEACEDYYSEETGFKREEDDFYMIF